MSLTQPIILTLVVSLTRNKSSRMLRKYSTRASRSKTGIREYTGLGIVLHGAHASIGWMDHRNILFRSVHVFDSTCGYIFLVCCFWVYIFYYVIYFLRRPLGTTTSSRK